jgi:hypothetical protein
LVFELIDHFSSGLAALTLGRRQASGDISAWDCTVKTPNKFGVLIGCYCVCFCEFFPGKYAQNHYITFLNFWGILTKLG